MTGSYGRQLGRYSLARFALFLLCCVALAAVGLRGLPLVAVALLVSSIVGLFALRGLREGFVDAAAARTQARREEQARLRAQLDDRAP